MNYVSIYNQICLQLVLIMIKVQNRKIFYVVNICLLLMYKKSARFQLEN
jgi:hypothetical protein